MHTIHQLCIALRGEISGQRALDTATAMARFNRIVGSSDYAAAAALLSAQLQSYGGLDEVLVESFPIDGVRTYTGRLFGPAWQPHSARLEVVEPDPYLICDFADTPMCLPSGCPATPVAGVTAQVIDVGRGDRPIDYEGMNVSGKAVLATGLTTDVYNLAVEEHGAACVMTTNMYDWSNLPERKRSMLDLPDATHLARLYFDAEKIRPAPVFSITYRHAERLRAQMGRGPVRVHATVQTETKPGDLLEVIATIRGTDLAAEEVWLMAHLCHPKPGACDNGSGVALTVELFRSMAVLMRQGQIPRPRRTLRLLLLPEVSGTQAYMDRYQARMDKVIASINLDMVGASYAATGAYCRLVQTPWSRPSFLNPLGAFLLEQVSLGAQSHIRHAPVRDWLYAVAPYDKGSDHDVLLNSIYAIPSLFFFYWPHRYYHTDLDTPDKLDPVEFERTGVVAAVTALVAANMTVELADSLIDLIHAEAAYTVTSLGRGCHPALTTQDGDGEMGAGQDRLFALGEMAQGTLKSVVDALPPAERVILAGKMVRLQADLARLVASFAKSEERLAGAGDRRVPSRLDPWPLNFGQIEKTAEAGVARLKILRDDDADFDDKAVAALNYVDGARTIDQIARLVCGELGPFPIVQGAQYMELLADAGIVKLNP